jgi:hypothetical protein
MRQGVTVTIRVRIDSIRSSGGDVVALPQSGVTCIVGGNNMGKSQLLREIHGRLASEETISIAIDRLNIVKSVVEPEQAASFLARTAVLQLHAPGTVGSYAPVTGGQTLTMSDFLVHYNAGPDGLLRARDFFCWYASAGSLAGFASGGVGNVGMGPVAHPLMRLFRDGGLELEISDLCHDAFGQSLTLDRINGDVRLRVGEPDVDVPPMNHPTLEYADAVSKLVPLEAQGDGIKSFLGLALAVVAGSTQMLLVDEPEAFLHPSQARALGRWLSEEAVKRDIQVLLATHDRDLLLGLLDGASSATVNIVRITRVENSSRLHQLPPDQVAAVWADPVLRYSNVLQGLFHGVVVICEADADCRFYGAALDQVAIDTDRRARADDTLLVPSGGKYRIAAMAKSLTRLGVDARAIVDFDVLRKREDVFNIVLAVGGAWTDQMQADYLALARVANEAALWEQLKHQGPAGLPSGSSFVACEQLLGDLSLIGVYIVPVGEMEDFDKNIGFHGAAWVSAMLESDGHKTCLAARKLLGYVLEPPVDFK